MTLYVSDYGLDSLAGLDEFCQIYFNLGMKQAEELSLTKAHQLGIKINFADSPIDIEEEGIHVYATNMEQIVEAVEDAIRHGCDMVMIHYDKATWPFSFKY